MEDKEGDCLPFEGPQAECVGRAEGTNALLPLRLLLPASGYVMEISQRDMVVGRHTGAQIRLPLPDISRRHCRFVFLEGTWQVVDLHSLNGVYVNGTRVRRAVLHHRDVVGIGGFDFEVEMGKCQADDARGVGEVIQRIVNALPGRATQPPPQKRRRAS